MDLFAILVLLALLAPIAVASLAMGIVPSRRLRILVAAAAALFAAALAVPGLSTVALAADVIVVLIFTFDLAATPRRSTITAGIRVGRVVSLGTPERIGLEISSAAGAGGPAYARLVVPDHWDAPDPPAPFDLQAHGVADLVVTATPKRRGRFELGPVHVRYPSLLGFFERDAVCAAKAEVKVYPAVSSLKKYQVLVRRMRLREMGFRPQRMRGQGMEFARLREHQPDDDPRLVDWKATARRGRLIAREYQVERCQTIMMMVDAGRMLTEEVDGLVKFEYALHAALLLTRVAAEYDDRVGAIVFSDRIERSAIPRKGRAAVPALAEALFDAEPKLCEADYDRAFEHLQTVCRKRALVVLFTSLVDQETSALVSGYLRAVGRRHVPLCVAIGDREIAERAAAVPKTEDEAYEKAAACRLLAARARTIQDLQRRGVQVIDAVSGQVPVALVNRYLDLKARQLL